MASGLDRILSGSPYGFGEGKNAEDLDPDALRQALLAIARGGVAEPVSGVVGLGSLPWGVDKAVSNMESVRDYIGYQPSKTDHLDYIARAAEPITDWAKENIGDLREKAGGFVLDKTGSPGLAAAAHSAPEALGLIAGGGMLMPAVRTAGKVGKGVDNTRRNIVLGGAGLAAATALAPKMAMKSIMDVPTGVSTKAAATAASAAAKGITRAAITTDTHMMIRLLRSYPILRAAYDKGGRQGFRRKLNDMEQDKKMLSDDLNMLEQSDGFQTNDKGLLDDYDNMIEESRQLHIDTPYVERSSRMNKDKHGRQLEDDFDTVNWDDVDKYIDSPNSEMDIRNIHTKDRISGTLTEPNYSMDISKHYNDYPDGMTPDDINSIFTDLSNTDIDFGGIMSMKDYKRSLKDSIGYGDAHPKTLKSMEDMLKDKNSYDKYIDFTDQYVNDPDMEYYF